MIDSPNTCGADLEEASARGGEVSYRGAHADAADVGGVDGLLPGVGRPSDLLQDAADPLGGGILVVCRVL